MKKLLNITKMKNIGSPNGRPAKNSRVRLTARRVIRDFARNTGIHGIKYLDERSANSGPVVKLFWSAILVLAFLGEVEIRNSRSQ